MMESDARNPERRSPRLLWIRHRMSTVVENDEVPGSVLLLQEPNELFFDLPAWFPRGDCPNGRLIAVIVPKSVPKARDFGSHIQVVVRPHEK